MSYLIDGNNLMPHLQARTRRELLERISRFAQMKKIKVAVVFDGAEDDFFRDGASYKGVKLFYARRNSDADERIKNLVENSTERKTLIVITSDRALADYCRRSGAKIVNAPDFRRKLVETENQSLEKVKLEGVKSEELDNWMRYFGVSEID